MSAPARAAAAGLDGRMTAGAEAALADCPSFAGGGASRVDVAEIQRARLLTAAVRAMDERGYAEIAVSHITERAHVSRRTFYDLFENRNDCLNAAFEDTLQRVRAEIAAVGLHGQSWRERVRGGLAAILSFFDQEPALARAAVVQAARGSERMLTRRAEVFAELERVIGEGRRERHGADTPPLVAEGLVGAVHAIVLERLLQRSPEPLLSLLPALMGMIVLPYLGPSAARRERMRPAPAPAHGQESPARLAESGRDDCLREIPMRLTYRTVRVLQAVAQTPGISNRAVGRASDVADQGQISKLLARLERLGLLDSGGRDHGKGEPNAWRLTSLGERVMRSIQVRAESNQIAASNQRAA